MTPQSTTRTSPARVPDGWWTGHPRYRNYVLFAATGFVLSAGCVVLLLAIRALGRGHAAWQAYLAHVGSLPGQLGCWLLLFGTLFFSLRWLRVGVKIPLVRLGIVPAPPEAVIWVAHFAGLFALTTLVLLLLAGVIL